MKIDVGKLVSTKENVLEEDVVLNEEKFKFLPPLLDVKKLQAKAKVHRYQDFIDVDLSIKADVVLQCSYTLKPFDYKLSEEDEIHFASYDDGGDDIQIYKGNLIDLDPYIYNLLSAAVPTSPKAPGAKLPESGKNFRVLSEEEFNEEKNATTDPRFDKLKDLDLD